MATRKPPNPAYQLSRAAALETRDDYLRDFRAHRGTCPRCQAASRTAEACPDGGILLLMAARAEIHASHAPEPPARREPRKPAERAACCTRCGFTFTRPQTRQTCQSEAACAKRQAARAA